MTTVVATPTTAAIASINNTDHALGTTMPHHIPITASVLLLTLAACTSVATAGDSFPGFDDPIVSGSFPAVDRWAMDAGDLNGDGHADLLISNDLDVQLALGDGTGHFTPATAVDPYTQPSELILADVDGDDDLDATLFSHHYQVGVRILRNDGQANFTEEPIDLNREFYAGAVEDMNGDGHLDIIAFGDVMHYPDPGPRAVHIWTNDGTGNFTAEEPVASGVSFSNGLAVGDLTGDGHPDLVIHSRTQDPAARTVRVLLNDGAGEFTLHPEVINHGDVDRLGQIELADLDNDGNLDLVIIVKEDDDASPLFVHLGDGDGTFAPGLYYNLHQGTPTDLHITDVNLDGDLDLVVSTSGDPEITTYLNIGEANFIAQHTAGPSGDSTAALRIATADADDTATPDLLIVGYVDEAIGIYTYLNRTPTAPPAPFTLLAPKDGTVALAPLTPTLAWSGAQNLTTSHTITIARDEELTDIIHQADGVTGLIYNVPVDVLDPGTQYHWTVTASNTLGDVPASNGPFTFATLIPGDLTEDGVVNVFDLLELLGNWGGAR